MSRAHCARKYTSLKERKWTFPPQVTIDMVCIPNASATLCVLSVAPLSSPPLVCGVNMTTKSAFRTTADADTRRGGQTVCFFMSHNSRINRKAFFTQHTQTAQYRLLHTPATRQSSCSAHVPCFHVSYFWLQTLLLTGCNRRFVILNRMACCCAVLSYAPQAVVENNSPYSRTHNNRATGTAGIIQSSNEEKPIEKCRVIRLPIIVLQKQVLIKLFLSLGQGRMPMRRQ